MAVVPGSAAEVREETMDARDQLSEIPGIGSARARWLEATFGVRSFRDLAALSADEIERKLKEEGRQAVAAAMIESWISEAESRVHERPKPVVMDSQKRNRGNGAEDETTQWTPAASFVVEFQSRTADGAEKPWRTAVHYLEEDRNEVWVGIDCEQLCRWMTRQLGPRWLPAREEELGRAEGDREAEAAEERAARSKLPRSAEPLRANIIDGDGVENASLIRIDKPWTVVFSWSPRDVAAEGEWLIDVLLRLVGPGEKVRLREGPTRLPFETPRLDGSYRYRFDVPTGVVTSAHVETLYRGLATVVFRPANASHILPVGFVDLGLLRFFDPAESVPAEQADSLTHRAE
jgi:hypothetical protein